MLMKDEVNRIFTIMYPNLFDNKIIKFINEYSENVKQDFDYISKNEKRLSYSEWNYYYEKYKNETDYAILQKMISSNYFPSSLANKLIIKLIDRQEVDIIHISQKNQTLTMALSRNRLGSEVMTALTEHLMKHFIMDNYILTKYNKIPESNLKLIAKIYLESIYEKCTSDCSKPLAICLHEIKDEDFLRKIIKDYNIEKYRNPIIENIYISDDFKKEIYEMGVDFSKIDLSKLPLEISNEIYRSIMSAYTDTEVNAQTYSKFIKTILTSSDKQAIDVYINAKNSLTNAVRLRQLSYAQEYNLFQTIKNMKLPMTNELLTTILMYTDNTDILRESSEIKYKKDAMCVYQNKHIPEDILIKRANNIIRNVNRRYKINSKYSLSNDDLTYLLSLIINKNIRLPDDAYNILLNNTDINTVQPILASTCNTPIPIIDKIIENHKSSNTNTMFLSITAKLNKEIRENFDDEKVKLALYVLAKVDAKNIKSAPNLIYNIYNTDKDNGILFCHNILQSLDVLEKNSKYEKERDGIKLFKSIISDALIELNVLNKDYSECKSEILDKAKNQIIINMSTSNFNAIDFYENIEDIVSELKQIHKRREEIFNCLYNPKNNYSYLENAVR